MKKSKDEIIFLVIDYVVITLLCLICIVPLLYQLACSFSSGAALDAGKVFLWPVGFTTSAYRLLFSSSNIVRYFLNSLLLTGVGTVLGLVFTVLCAYPLSKKYMKGRKTISFLITFTMMFGGGMIPTFMLVRYMGLINSYWSIWLTSLITPYNMMVMRSFFEGIPEELGESGRIDGCGEWRLLFNIYLPLSKASLATETLFYAVGYWNVYERVMLYITNTNKYTLPVFIQQMIFQLSQVDVGGAEASAIGATDIVSESVKSASVIILLVPVLIIYPFLQKYFVKGVTLGAVKG